jgi:NitT/TauT family transport system permease protein
VVLRHVLPKLLDSIRLQIGPAMVFLIAAEYIAADEGYGYRIRLEQKKLNMAVVYPYLAMLAAFGFTMDYAMRRLRNYCSPWYAGQGS